MKRTPNGNLFLLLPDNLISYINSLQIGGKNAQEWQYYVGARMVDYGFNIAFEYPMQYVSRNGKRHSGRIDIVARKDGFSFAIECDMRSPRYGSIQKVKNYGCGCIILRDPQRLTLQSPST